MLLQIALLLGFPYLTNQLHQSGKTPHWLSPVILCYAFGILLANLPFIPLEKGTIYHDIADMASQATILFAIPLLLFSTDIVAWLKLARSTLTAFALVVFSGLICSFIAAYFLHDYFADAGMMSGMLVGIYTGGIPNLNAIGIAKGASPDLITYMNAADIVVGGSYFLFLTSFAPLLFGKFLPKFKQQMNSNIAENSATKATPFHWKDAGFALLLTVFIIAISVGLTMLFTGELKSVSIIILLLTLGSVLASFSLKIRQLRSSFELGEYFILIFCIAIGMLADFSEVWAHGLGSIAYTAAVLWPTVLLHLLLCRFFKIDRDTMLITSTAALYGPPFIGQIASVIGNRQLIFSGMMTGLVGYAIGNFLGIGMVDLLHYLGF